MKINRIFSITGLLVIGLSPLALAAGHGGGGGGGGGGFGGGFGPGPIGGGHVGGGGGFHSTGGRPASGGRPAYFYSRGMGFAGSRPGRAPSRIQQSHSPARITMNPTTGRGVAQANSAQRNQRATL